MASITYLYIEQINWSPEVLLTVILNNRIQIDLVVENWWCIYSYVKSEFIRYIAKSIAGENKDTKI